MAISSPSNQVTKILQIQVDSEKAIDTLSQLNDILEDVRRQEAQLTKEIQANAKQQTLSQQQLDKKKKELQALKQAEKDYKTMVNEVSKVVQNELKADRAKTGSLKELRAQMSNLTKQYDELSRVDREGLKGKQLQKDINALTKEIKDAEYATQRFQRNVGNYRSALQGFGKLWLGAAAGIAVATRAIRTFANEYKVIADFEQANVNLSTILGVNKTQMDELTNSALELGRTTEYTASQVTSLQTELAKLGFTQQEILNMQKPILQFATAVGTDLASAASLAGATLRIFELDSTKTEEVLATLAVATNKSALNFSFLQNAMSTVGPVANTFGISVKDTTALLGTLANAGFDASSAATATRNILLNLANANGKLAQTLGGSVTTFNEIMDALIKLRDAGVNLNETLELTDKRSVAAFNAFLSGAEASKTLREELENVDGELDRIQSERLDTVEGSIKLMKSAWEGFILSMSNSTGTIKNVIDMLTRGIEGVTYLFRDTRIGEYAKNEVETLQQVFDKYGAEYFEQYVANRRQEYSQLFIKAGSGKKQREMGERLQGFNEAVEQVDMSEENLTYEQRLDQIQRIYEWKVKQFQDNISLSSKEVERMIAEAEAERTASLQAANKAKLEEMEAEKAAAEAAAKAKNESIIAEDERARKERERKQKQYNDLVFREQQKAEDALINLIKDSQEKRLAQENRNYEKSKATIEKAMQEEAQKHGTQTQLYQIYLTQLETLEQQHQLNMENLQRAFDAEDLRRTIEIYRTKIDIAKKNSEEQFNLRKELLQKQMEQELANIELTEEQKEAIRLKYANQEAQLRDEQAKAVADQIALEWQNRITQAQINQEDYAQLELDMLKERLDNIQQYELESDEQFLARKLALEKAYIDKKQALAQREVQIETAKMSAIAGIMGNLSDLLEEAGDENEEWVALSKILALAEIAINTGVAIAKGIAQSQSVPYPANIAAVATTIAEIIAGVTSAISTVKSAKFARGTSYVEGPGTSTSDSIPALLSKGEGVVNARGNALFPGLVAAINDIGNGISVPASNQTTYNYTTVANAAGGITPDQIADAMSQMPPSEVAVTEIKRVNDRINVVENLRNY